MGYLPSAIYLKIMRNTLLYLAFLTCPLTSFAQESAMEVMINDDVLQQEYKTQEYESPAQSITPMLSDSTSLNLPTLTEYGQLPTLHYPFLSFYNWPTWDLHKGFNVSLGASVFSTFGSGNTWSGAGFSENASLMYAMPLGKGFSLAVGGYIKNTSWAHTSFRSAGLSALINYQVNDRLNVYAYGQKSLLNNKQIPLPLWYMTDIADRIGVGAEYKISPSVTIGVSVDYNRYNGDCPWFGRANMNSRQSNREFPQ